MKRRLPIEGRSVPSPSGAGLVMLDSGFRPFFLLAGIYACVPLVAWLVLYARGASFFGAWPAMRWHGHEMAFGYAAAALAGFLLTAVPKWTKTPPVSRGVLALLVGAWLAGRVAMWTSGWLPRGLVAAADLALFPMLAFVIGRAVYGSRNRRNFAFPILLGLLAGANALTHVDPGGAMGRLGGNFAIAVVVVAIVIVGGRIVPAFTWGALEKTGSVARRPRRALRVATLLVCPAALALDFGLGLGEWAGGVELAAGVLVLASMTAWYGHRTLREPILWVLHLGWAWVGVAFLLRGASAFAIVPASVGLHAFTAGAMGTMILGVMSRAALGHTGRPLRVHPLTVLAYALVSAGAAARVFGPLAVPAHAHEAILTGGALFVAGYALFVAVYLPVLTRPRVDGSPG